MSSEHCIDIPDQLDDQQKDQLKDTLADPPNSLTEIEVSRRTFIKTTGILGTAVVTGIPQLVAAQQAQAAAATTPQMLTLTLKVNGKSKSLSLDTRTSLLDALREHLLPRFDRTFSVLLEDLQQRGLLDSTLVVCMGEFGRAPRVALERNFAGASPGRKHWASVYSIVFAGAGVRGGKVLGASDRLGAYPATPPYSPADVAATLFASLGIDPASHYRDALDRPFRIVEGKPIRGLYEA